MKDNHARALAIIALVFMGIFIAALIAALVDSTLFNGGIGYIALCAGVFVFVCFLALKADGRGFSLTKMKNESEMKKIEQALKEQEEQEKAEAEGSDAQSEEEKNTSDSDNTD